MLNFLTDLISTLIFFSIVQHEGPIVPNRSTTLSLLIGGRNLFLLKAFKKTCGTYWSDWRGKTRDLGGNSSKKRGQLADGKRKKSVKFPPEVNPAVTKKFVVDADDDCYIGTSNQGIEENSPYK